MVVEEVANEVEGEVVVRMVVVLEVVTSLGQSRTPSLHCIKP